jgi:hypothetical protein
MDGFIDVYVSTIIPLVARARVFLDTCWNTEATCRVMLVFTIARSWCCVAKFRFKDIGYARKIKSVFRIR